MGVAAFLHTGRQQVFTPKPVSCVLLYVHSTPYVDEQSQQELREMHAVHVDYVVLLLNAQHVSSAAAPVHALCGVRSRSLHVEDCQAV